jgi:hypothetical protein
MNKKRITSGFLCVVMLVSLALSAMGCKQVEPENTIAPTENVTEPAPVETTVPVEPTTVPQETEPAVNMEEVIKSSVSAGIEDSVGIKDILQGIVDSESLPISCVVEDIPEEFMPGFKNKIEGFTDGAMLMPVIGSQPFIVYLFNTEDADTLMETLKEEADPRWNICTEATVTVCENYENFVLFAMLP